MKEATSEARGIEGEEPMRCVSAVIADRYPVFLRGLSDLLSAESDFRIVARCSDGAGCIDAIRVFRPDIAILDFSMPDISGLKILTTLNSENLSTRLVFLATSVEERDLTALAAAGAYGVILKDQEPEILLQTVRQVAAGERVLPLSSSEEAISRVRTAMTEKGLALLTERERQIMHLVSEGLSNKEIGRRLNVTDGTIKVHLHHVFQKLDISNRTSLAALAISQNELIDRPVETGAPASGKR
jgi:two-component system, NarL family, nitrate/nitrite response regulator NarL